MTERVEARGIGRGPWEIAAGLVLLAVLLVWFRPLTPHHFDETLFTLSGAEWNPREHQPPAPGYPLLIGVAGLIAPLAPGPFEALVAMSIAGSLLGFIAFSRAFALLCGSAAGGVAGALLVYLAPVMLMHGSSGMSEGPALAFVAAALLWAFRLAERREDHALPDLLIFAAAAAAGIGFRPQFAIALIPLLAWGVAWVRPWKSRAIVLAAFAVVCLLWIAPLAASFGGIAPFLAWERGEASSLAGGGVWRSGSLHAVVMDAARFLAHPWGMKWLSIPLLALAALGAARLAMRRERLLVPLALFGVPYLLFALLAMDPADGPRYGIPFSVVVAALAGAGASVLFPWLRGRAALVAVLAWGGFAFAYVQPVLSARRDHPSPPVSAASWARTNLPSGAVMLVDPPLMPHGRLLLGSFETAPIEEGLRRFATRPETPLWMFVDGYSPRRDAAKFWWPRSDAWGKLTRGRYRVVSVVPVPPEERFIPLEGVEALEVAEDGSSWRWLLEEARLVVPPRGASRVEFRFLLPEEAPHEEVSLSLYVEEDLRAGLPVRRGRVSTARLRMPEGGLLTVVADKTWVPADHGGSDRRELGVKLVGMRQIP
jgi:hypothetical protein